MAVQGESCRVRFAFVSFGGGGQFFGVLQASIASLQFGFCLCLVWLWLRFTPLAALFGKLGGLCGWFPLLCKTRFWGWPCWFRRLPEFLAATLGLCWAVLSGICLALALAAGCPHTSVARFRFCQVVPPAAFVVAGSLGLAFLVEHGLLLLLRLCAFVPAASACSRVGLFRFTVGFCFSGGFVTSVVRRFGFASFVASVACQLSSAFSGCPVLAPVVLCPLGKSPVIVGLGVPHTSGQSKLFGWLVVWPWRLLLGLTSRSKGRAARWRF